MKKILTLGLMILLSLAARAAEDHLAAVAAASRAWDEAYAAGDAGRLADRYEATAVSMPPGLPALVGRAAIAADFEAFFRDHIASHRTFEAERRVAGEFAIERARYEAKIVPRAGGAAVQEAGKHIVVYRRQADGAWKVHWEIWNSDS